ncbi:hypothetical protein MPAR168_24050 [Methylorubrum populi]|uniref:ATP-dependent endonuclease n=1 Tax=Methylobacterium radiotolerans TaxID=31998 RepID=A0ABU7T5R4_9HYPH
MTTFLVVEGPSDAAVMRTLITAAEIDDIAVISGQGKSSAMSLAKSLAVSRAARVAVLVDADTRDPRQIDEQRRTFRDLQGSAVELTRLFLAVPTLEEELFPDAETFVKIFKVAITERQRQKFAADRRRVIRTYFTTSDDGQSRVKSHGKMDVQAARDGFGRPLLTEIFAYLRAT